MDIRITLRVFYGLYGLCIISVLSGCHVGGGGGGGRRIVAAAGSPLFFEGAAEGSMEGSDDETFFPFIRIQDLVRCLLLYDNQK